MFKKQTVSIVIEILLEHGIHSLPFSVINDVIDLSSTMTSRCQLTSSGQHSAKGLSKTFDNSAVAIVTNL